MTISRLLVTALAAVGAASAAESPVVQAAARAEKKAALAPPPLAMEFRLRAAVVVRMEANQELRDATQAHGY